MLEYLSSFGLGAVVVTLVQTLLNLYHEKRTRAFNEKKEAFVGLLDAYRQVAIKNTDQERKKFDYWQIRCELVSNTKIRQAIQSLKDTNPNTVERFEAHETLTRLLRKDLGISN